MERPDVIDSLRHILKRQYEQGYDSTCDTIEETIVELERLRQEREDQFERANEWRSQSEKMRERAERAEMDRDHAWDAFTRLRKAYAMVRYPTLNEEIKLLYDTADAVAYGKATSGDAGQNPAVTPAKPAEGIPQYKFGNVYCSVCGGEFGPGNHGFSNCDSHKHLPRLS